MFPRFGHKNLHRLIHRSTECHQQAEQKRIYTINIIEINNLQLLPTKQTEHPGTDKQGENNHEVRSMRITEQVNEL